MLVTVGRAARVHVALDEASRHADPSYASETVASHLAGGGDADGAPERADEEAPGLSAAGDEGCTLLRWSSDEFLRKECSKLPDLLGSSWASFGPSLAFRC